MGAAMQWTPLALLVLATLAPCRSQTVATAAAGAERQLSVQAGAPLRVECALRVEAAPAWRLDGGAPPADLVPSEHAAPGGGGGGAVVARLEAVAARAHHAGLYTCGPAPQQRVRVLVQPQPQPVAEDAGADGITYWDVGRALELTCDVSNKDKLPVIWRKNGTEVTSLADVASRVRLEAGGAKFVLPARTHEDDFGNYSCAVGGAEQAWRVHGAPHAKLPPNTNVVEGQRLRLTCRLVGKPYPRVRWYYSNGTGGNDSWVPAGDALGQRGEVGDSEQGVAGGELTVAAAALADAGRLACAPQGEGPEGAGAAVTTLRVKDMYAALWPFLGICAEVFVLCAVILIYEKRRTKPEMDDSDTDTHDQKKS